MTTPVASYQGPEDDMKRGLLNDEPQSLQNMFKKSEKFDLEAATERLKKVNSKE